MLVISQKKGDKLHIGRDITISIIDARSGKVRIGIDAPSECPILRESLVYSDKDSLTPAQAELARYQQAKDKQEREADIKNKSKKSSTKDDLSSLAKSIALMNKDEAKGELDTTLLMKILEKAVSELSASSKASSSAALKATASKKQHNKKSERLLKKKAKRDKDVSLKDNAEANNVISNNMPDDKKALNNNLETSLDKTSNVQTSDVLIKSLDKGLNISCDSNGVAHDAQYQSPSDIALSDKAAPTVKDSALDVSNCMEKAGGDEKSASLLTNACNNDTLNDSATPREETDLNVPGVESVDANIKADLPALDDIIVDPLGLVRSLGDAYIEEPEQESIPSKRKSSRKRSIEHEGEGKTIKVKVKAKKK